MFSLAESSYFCLQKGENWTLLTLGEMVKVRQDFKPVPLKVLPENGQPWVYLLDPQT